MSDVDRIARECCPNENGFAWWCGTRKQWATNEHWTVLILAYPGHWIMRFPPECPVCRMDGGLVCDDIEDACFPMLLAPLRRALLSGRVGALRDIALRLAEILKNEELDNADHTRQTTAEIEARYEERVREINRASGLPIPEGK